MSKRDPDKGKAPDKDKAPKMVKASSKEIKTSFKSIAMTDVDQVKRQKINDTPKAEKLRDDAYELALAAQHPGEYIFPYISISTKWVIPIENKIAHLQPNEVVSFYFKNHADSFVYQKDYQYFQDILFLPAQLNLRLLTDLVVK